MRWILALCLAGCGAAEGTGTDKAPLPPMEDPDQPVAPRASERPAADSGCPLALPGAQVRSEVTADGVALIFTISGGDAAELRDRVERMADRHNARQALAGQPDNAGAAGDTAGGMTSREGAHGVDMHGAAKSVPSRAAVEEIAGGARIVFTPSDPAKVALLREHIRVHGKEMASTSCDQQAEPVEVPPPPPSGGDRTAPPPTPAPRPDEPVLPPDRPVTPPDQPVTPPAPPPPPTGVPFVGP